ncbi:MAG: hypothetical protein HY372_00700 [Candidatus Andersenbacteria bacterium]|nr:hypothetical protein [Candidatus Andersenbacteria bacterium]
MSSAAALIIQTLGLVLFYAIVGFGPGMALGLMLGNQLGARGKETLMRKTERGIKQGLEHNAQWNPIHPRWRR